MSSARFARRTPPRSLASTSARGPAAPPPRCPCRRRSPHPARNALDIYDRQDAAQTVVMQFQVAPKRAIADYTPLVMADAVWGGGGFGTRLNLNLREDKGYLYRVFQNLSSCARPASGTPAGLVQTDKTKRVGGRVRQGDEGDRRRQRRSPTTEFASAKQTKVRGFAQTFESDPRVGDQIERLWGARAADERAAGRIRRGGEGDAAGGDRRGEAARPARSRLDDPGRRPRQDPSRRSAI